MITFVNKSFDNTIKKQSEYINCGATFQKEKNVYIWNIFILIFVSYFVAINYCNVIQRSFFAFYEDKQVPAFINTKSKTMEVNGLHSILNIICYSLIDKQTYSQLIIIHFIEIIIIMIVMPKGYSVHEVYCLDK